MKATELSQMSFRAVQNSVLELAGVYARPDEALKTPSLDTDELETFVTILEKLAQFPKFKNNPMVSSLREKLAPSKKMQIYLPGCIRHRELCRLGPQIAGHTRGLLRHYER